MVALGIVDYAYKVFDGIHCATAIIVEGKYTAAISDVNPAAIG